MYAKNYSQIKRDYQSQHAIKATVYKINI